MPDRFLPGAEVRQVHPGWTMAGGPPRATWHITDDALTNTGEPAISASGVADYLNNVGYQPTIVWDPVTGQVIQLLPADVGGSALEGGPPETNKMGTVNIQVEAYFTPNETRFGVRYAQLTDTPCTGLDAILRWMDSWGIPRVAPLAPGNRNPIIWASVAGHYGHYNVPNNSHVDPIVAIPDLLNKVKEPITVSDKAFRFVYSNQDWVFDGPSRMFVPTGTPAQLAVFDKLGVVALGPVDKSVYDLFSGVAASWK